MNRCWQFLGSAGWAPSGQSHASTQKAVQGGRFAAVNHSRIALQKSRNCGSSTCCKPSCKAWSQLLNLAIAYICIGTDDGKTPRAQYVKVGVEMRGQWSHTKRSRRSGSMKVLHLPGSPSRANSGLCESILRFAACWSAARPDRSHIRDSHSGVDRGARCDDTGGLRVLLQHLHTIFSVMPSPRTRSPRITADTRPFLRLAAEVQAPVATSPK